MAAKELWTSSLNSKKDLRLFSKEELHSHMKTLAIREREHQADVVAGVSEVARRKLYYDYGFTSLFDYMTKGRGFPNSSAQRYIDAARLCSVVPTLKEDIANGEVNLSQVTVVAKTLRQKEREEPNFKMEVDQATALFDRIKGEDVKSSQQIIAQELKVEVRQQEIARAQADGSVRLEITLSKEQEAMLQRVKELISHTHLNPSFAEVFEHLAQEFLKRKDPLVAQGRSGKKTDRITGMRTGIRPGGSVAKKTDNGTANETVERVIDQTAGKSRERSAENSANGRTEQVAEAGAGELTHRNTDPINAESVSEKMVGPSASVQSSGQGADVGSSSGSNPRSVYISGAEAVETHGNGNINGNGDDNGSGKSGNHFNLELTLNSGHHNHIHKYDSDYSYNHDHDQLHQHPDLDQNQNQNQNQNQSHNQHGTGQKSAIQSCSRHQHQNQNRHSPQLDHQTSSAHRTQPSPSPSDRTYIPVRTVRFVYRRDQSCRHRDETTGGICGSRFQLQIDHVQPLWAGGGDEPENLQLLCGAHNRLKYRREVGIRSASIQRSADVLETIA